ncbi:MAG: SDR family NAD(P)-dependent oxidoreductase [Gammaproteobacteria bacterium]
MSQKHCLVIGVGAGTGAAVCRRFSAADYRVSMIARSNERLAGFTAEIANTTPYATDIVNIEHYRETLTTIASEQGIPDVVIYNATLATFGALADLDYRKLERNFRANCTGLMVTAQTLSPAMVERGGGSIVVTGNTAALRGKPDFIGWSSTKAAQRNMAECLARELGPRGVHVAYVVIDALIDMPFARNRRPQLPDDFFAKPDDLADEIYHVAHQPRSAQSFLVELRPFGEAW